MNYRRLGTTDLELSEISFGTGDNAGLMVIGRPEDRRQAVERAVHAGVNHFDTAADYGKGRAEQHLGEILRELDLVAGVVVTTKVEIRAEDLADIAGNVVRLGEECLARLGLPRIDILQIHNAPAERPDFSGFAWPDLTADQFLGPGGALEGLQRLRDAGRVRYFGFNCEHAQVAVARALLDSREFHAINLWFNLLNPTAGGSCPPGLQVDYDYDALLEYAAGHGVGCAIIRPLSGGALTPRATTGSAPHPLAGGLQPHSPTRQRQIDLGRAARLAFLADGTGRSLAQAAYQFILRQPAVTTVIGGFSETGHLEEALAAYDAPPLSESELAHVANVWADNFGVPNGKSAQQPTRRPALP